MSIATRIQAIEEHISDAYDSLSKFGVAAPTNKNIENIASLVDEIYNNTPKTDYASGTNLTLENTRVGKIDFKDTDTIEKIGLGATDQYTTTAGKNLLVYPYTDTTKTNNGITYTDLGDGRIKVNGTATANSAFSLYGTVSSQITLNANYVYGGVNSNIRVRVMNRNSSGTYTTLGNSTGSSTLINKGTYETGYVEISILNGTTVDDLIITPMLTEIQDNNYESYIDGKAIPNPNNPQNIYVVKDNSKIKMLNKNLLPNYRPETQTLNSVVFTNNGNGTFSLSGTASAYTQFIDTNSFFLSAGTYTLYSPNLNNKIILQLRSPDGYTTIANTGNTTSKLYDTFTLNTQTEVKARIVINASETDVEITPMIYVGNYDETTTFVLHKEQNYEINLSSKNLFDKDDSNLIMDNIYINPTGYVLRATNGMKTICMPCKPNTAYVVSKVSSARFVIGSATSNATGTSMTTGRNNFTGTQLTLTTGANDKYLLVFYYNSNADTLSEETIRNSIQVEVGSTATSYTPYFNIELYKTENYQDYIYKTSGKNLFNENNYLSNAGISYSTIVTSNNNNLFYMPVQYGKNYIISFVDKGVSGNILYGFSNDIPVMGGTCTYNVLDITTLNNYVFTPVNENNKYLCIRLNVNATNQYKAMANIQVEIGDVATTYESYGKGNWYLHKEISKKIVDSNTSITGYTTNVSGYYRYGINISDIKILTNGRAIPDLYCSHYKGQMVGNDGSWGAHQGIAIDNTHQRVYINDDTYYTQDATAYKTWIANNNLTIYYPLATPTETQITDATLISQLNAWYNAQSMDDITYITVDGDLPIQLKLRALKK